MKDEDLIKLAQKIVNENNLVYKFSAKSRSFIIYATDGNGTVDRFITGLNDKSEFDWKSKFESAGFKNVSVRPFGTSTTYGGQISGDLSFDEVDTNFFNNSTNRPKITYNESPTRQNPYEGYQYVPADSRLTTPSVDSTNELQNYMFEKLKSTEDRIRAGWYGGSLISWLSVLSKDSEGKQIENLLLEEFPYMNNSMLEKHLIDRQLKLEEYKPSKYEIRYFSIVMQPLAYYISTPDVSFTDVPEDRVKQALDSIIKSAMSFRKHKQYGSKEMSEFFDEHQRKLVKRQDDIKDAVFFLLKGLVG